MHNGGSGRDGRYLSGRMDRPHESAHSPAGPSPLHNRRLLVIQPAIPEYRVGFFRTLAEEWPGEVVVAHGADAGNSVANDTRPAPYRRVEIPWVASRWLGPQLAWAPIRDLARTAALMIVPGDPHALVAHRLLVRRRLGGKAPVIALSQFRGADARWLTSLIKPWWHRAFDATILYTQREAQHYLGLGHVADRLTWLDNGLARLPEPPSAAELLARQRSGPLVCLGRHVAKNRFDLAISGFCAYRQGGGQRQLVLIGQGPETPALRQLAEDLGSGCAAAITFAGSIYDPVELDAILRRCGAAIHPLAMGLSVNTAFSYGLQVIACGDDRRHMPEFWIWQDGITGMGIPAPRGREALAIPAIAAALQRLDALSCDEYARMAHAAYAAVAPLTTKGMADRVGALCRSLLGLPP